MTVDEMISALLAVKEKVGGNEEVPVVRVEFGENDFIIPDFPVVGDFEDQDGNKYRCAFVGLSGGEEFSKKKVPHYNWKYNKDKLEVNEFKFANFDGYIRVDAEFPEPTIVDMSDTMHVMSKRVYWEDATVNDEEDSDANPTIPFAKKNKDGEHVLDFSVNVKTGQISDWPKGTTAETHYKIVDEFEYWYKDFHYGPDYVPDFMAIDDKGFGDYMIISIDENGFIKNWSEKNFLKEYKQHMKECGDED